MTRIGIVLAVLMGVAILGGVVAVFIASPTVQGTPPASAPAAPQREATPSPTSAAPPLAEVGQTVSNRGITLTVTAARTVESIEMNESNFRVGSGYEKYTKTLPEQGGKFVMVETHIVNNGRSSLDLTCSFPINAKLVDDRDRNFDPIQDLYKLKGNPECNKQLQPGFEDDMTYVYLVPADAVVAGWGFQDVTDYSGSGSFTVVRIDA